MRVRLDIPLKLSEVECAISSRPCGITETIEYIVTDSREVQTGDLYFALDGENTSGTVFIPEVLERGGIPVSSSSTYDGLYVKNTRDALLSLAEYYLTKLTKLRERICITGSVGKTTTKEFLKFLLEAHCQTHATIGNYNNDIGVPLTVFSAPRDTEIIVIEIGTNHLGEISRLSEYIHPTLAIITNIGTSHIGNFGSKELIAKEKSSITNGMKEPRVLYEYGETLLTLTDSAKTVSTETSGADFYLMPITEDISGTCFDFYSRTDMMCGIQFNIPGRHMSGCLAFAIAAALTVGLAAAEIASRVPLIGEASVRHRVIHMDGYAILDDSYNSSRESVLADFRLMQFYRKFPLGALLGDILELGGETEMIHREIGASAYRLGISTLYLYGVYSVFIAEGAITAGMPRDAIHINSDIEHPEKSADDILKFHQTNEIILFKASHKLKLSNVIDILKSKGKS